MTVDILAKAGYPQQQITNLNNAIDTGAFKRDLAAVVDADLAAARQALGIAPTAPVGIFCGSLYPDKKLDFLVAACDRIHQQSPEFHCVVLQAPVDAVSFTQAQDLVLRWGHARESRDVVLANVHVVVTASTEPDFGAVVRPLQTWARPMVHPLPGCCASWATPRRAGSAGQT
jgi:hypothetical protein